MYGQQPNKIKPPQAPKPDDDREINIDEWDDIVADRYKVPRSLMKAVRGQESGGNVNAVSPTGVRGRYQVTQSTAKQYGLDRNDPWQQSVAAARYLRDLYDQTDGADDDEKWLGSVAKYYGGGNAVKDGVVSGRSVDGLSNPAEHVRRVAERWGQIRKSETTGAMAAPASRVSPFDETEDQAKARRAGMTPAQRKEDRRQTIGAMQNELVESSRIMQPPTPPSGKATAGVFGQSRKGQAELRKAFKVDPSTGIQVFEDAGINRVNQRAALTPGIERRRDEIARRKAAYDQLTPREQLLQRIGQPLSSEAYNRVNKDKIADLRRRAFNGDKTAQAELSQIEANQQDWEPVFRPDTQAGQLVSMIPNAALKGTGALIEGAGQLPAMSQRIMGTGRNLGRRIVGLPSQSSDNILTYGIEQAAKPLGRAITQSGDMIAPENPNDQSYPAAFARGAGSLVPFAAGAALTGGSAAAPAILGAAMNVGQYQQELDRSGQNVGAARRELGSIMAALAGLTEAAGIGRLLSRWGIDRGLLNRVINTVKEGGQEYLQDYLNDINAKLIAAYDEARRIGDWNSANRIQSFIVGAGLGAAGNVAEHMATAPERAANARNIQQIQAERAPMPGIAPSVPAGTQTQVTRITPEAARAANQPVAPSVTPDIANAPTEPLTEPIATNQIPSEAIPAPSQPNAPLFPAAQQAKPDFSQLQGFEKLAAINEWKQNAGKPSPEQALNDEFERLNALAESPDEADRKEAAKGYNRLLTKIRGSQQYATETRGGVTETPYRNARQVIEQRLQGLAKPKPQKAATPAVASQSAQLPDLLTQAEGFKQDAVAAEQAGNFEAAAIAYQSARDILRTANTRHGKTMAAPDLAALRQDINLQHGAFQNAQKQARDLYRQANKPTAGIPQPRRQAAQQPPPLMQSGAIVNPEGGIPAQAPKMTFTEELQRGIDQSDAARAKRKPGKRLVAKIAELGGISEEYRGELQSVADARRIGVIRKKPALSPDILAEQLREDGYDVDPNDLNTLWRAIDEDMSSERGFRPADSAALDRRLAEEEAAYYEKVQENERASTGRSGFSVPLGESAEQQASRPQSQQLRQDTGGLAPEADEDMAALRRARERSERENPREYGERTRPGEPAGISFSDYSVLQARNARAEQALYDSAPGSPRFRNAEAAIRQDAQQVGIAPRHVDAMVAYALNYHSEKAFWAERGLDLDKIQNPVEAAEAYIESVREEIRNETARLSGNERTEIEREVAAIDEVFNDPDMVELLDRAADGDQDAASDFKQLGVDYYGLKPETASELVRSREEGRQQSAARPSRTGQATAPSQAEGASTRSNTRQAARQLSADERRLVQTRPVEVFDQDFDDYTRKVESLYAQAVRGEVAIDPKRLYDPAKWVGLTPEQIEERRKAGEGAGLLAKIHGERAKRVEDGRLPARENLEQIEKYKGYSDEQLKALGKQEREGRKTRLETLENAVKVTLEKNPRGAKPEWMAEVRALDERLKGLRQPAEAKPAPTGRVIQHSQFGEVREAADQSGVAKGKLRVVDSEGAEHVIQNPRTAGNRSAAFAKSEKAEADRLAQHRADLMAKAKAYDERQKVRIQDVTPADYAPGESTSESRSVGLDEYNVTPDEQRLKSSIAEGEMLLRGKLSPEKRVQIQRSVDNTKQKLAELRAENDAKYSRPSPVQSAMEIERDVPDVLSERRARQKASKKGDDVDALLAAGAITPEQAAKMRRKPKISERREAPGAMPERYTGRQLFENARVEFRPARNRPATLIANDWGGAMMNRLLSEKYGESTTDANFTIAADDMQDLRDYLAETKDSGIYDEAQTANMDALLGQMDAAIKDAKANSQDVAFVTRKSGEPISQTKIKVRHETAHVSQSRVTPDMFALTERDWLGKQPEAAAVRAELERRGYPPETHAHESAVFVASGDFAAFGMNLDQATKFLSNYFKAVIQKHGRRALDRFGAIDPRLQPTLERARNEKTEAGQAANERRSVSYSSGNERAGTAGAEVSRSNAGVLAGRREESAGVPGISERKEAGFSFGRLENEPEGQIAAAGLGALQNLAGKIKKTKTPDAVPADYDVWDFYDQVMKQIMPGKDKQGNPKPPKTKINNEQADAIANGLLEMVEAADKQDFVGIFNAREKVRQAMLPAAKRDVKWYDHMQSRLSNLNFRGIYERIAGTDGKAVSEILRQAQVDIANGEVTRAEAVKNLRKELRPYIRQFQIAGKPGLARWIENHIDAVTDPDQSFKGLAGFMKGGQFYAKLAYNPRSAMINMFQPMQTLWPHLSTREWLAIQKRATSRKEWQRIGEIAARESGGSVEGLARPDVSVSTWRQAVKTGFFGYASEYNRVVGHLAGEMMADRQGITGREKARMAADWAKKVEFDNSQWDIPPLFSGPIAGVVGQFKPFMVKNLERLYADWKSSPYSHQKGKDYKYINPSGNLARRSKMIVGQVALGGIRSAIPGLKHIGGVLILGGLAKAFGKFMDDDDAEKMAEAVYFGLPALVEQDLSGSVTVFDEPFGKTAEEKMVNFFGGPTLSLAAKAWNTYGKVTDAKDTDKSTAAEKRKRALLSLGKAVSPYVKTGQAIAAAAKGETPKMWMGKEVPMTKKEAIGYGLMGTPLRQSKYWEHEEAPDWQKEVMPDRFTQSASTKTEFLNKFGQMSEQEIKRKPGEPDAVYQKRVERVSGWMNSYGEKLVNHPLYNLLTAEQKQKAIENLRDRVGKQMNLVRPNERTLEPQEVIKAVRKAATRKPRREQEKMWEAEN